MPKLFELKRDLAAKNAEARAIVQGAIDAQRDLTPEETTKVEGCRSAIGELQRKIATFELRDTFEAQSPEERQANSGVGVDLPDLDGKRPYSLMRALAMNLAVREGKGRYEGLEYEVHCELAKASGREASGIFIPFNLRNEALAARAREQRDVTTTTATGAIASILGTDLIDLLRNRMVVQSMGGVVLSNLNGGTFALPKQTSAATAYHVAEAASPTTSNPVLGQVVWTPRTLGATVNMSRKSLLQTSLDVEALVRADMMRVIAIEMDRVGLNGSGSGAVPTGILQNSNCPTVALGTNGLAPTWASIVQLETQVAAANADFGSLGYVLSNKGRSTLKQTAKIGSTFPAFIWENGGAPGEGTVNTYRAMASNQVPDTLTKGSGSNLSAIIFGNWASATYGLWSGVDMIVDPYSGSTTGAVKISAFIDYDFQERYDVGFAKIVDMITS